MNSPPFSQCDARGRCLRHPTIQMSRKKKLGGWKKLLSLCPMCAIELMAKDDEANAGGSGAGAFCSDVGIASPPPPRSGRSPPSRPRHAASDSVSLHSHGSSSQSSQQRRHRRAPRVGHHDQDDRSVDRSVDKSVHSAPSAYNRQHHRSPRAAAAPCASKLSSSDSSCDATADLSYSSEYSSASSPRPGLMRMASTGEMSAVSQGSQRSAHSARSGGSQRSAGSQGSRSRGQPRHQPRPYHYDAPATPYDAPDYGNTMPPNQEEFVCGMELYVEDDTRCFYTGQIHVATRLPHGLGTLRTEADGIMLEGRWEHGRLVQESNAPPAAVAPQDHQAALSPLEYPAEDCCDEGEYDQQQENYGCEEYADYCLPCTDEEPLCDEFRRCRVPSSEESSVSDSVAGTVEDDEGCETQSCSSASATGSYSARESKLREYEKYIVTCDDEGDYYEEDQNYYQDDYTRNMLSQPCASDFDRPKRVRFQGDP